MINKRYVKSSNIEYVAYDELKKELFVGFLNGHEYKYINVTHELYLKMLNADSKGKFFHQYIEKFFTCIKIK